MTTMYLTKYALTDGIREIDGVEVEEGEVYAYRRGYGTLRVGGDVFDDMDAAKVNAEDRRAKKIASLKKQIAKLEAIKF